VRVARPAFGYGCDCLDNRQRDQHGLAIGAKPHLAIAKDLGVFVRVKPWVNPPLIGVPDGQWGFEFHVAGSVRVTRATMGAIDTDLFIQPESDSLRWIDMTVQDPNLHPVAVLPLRLLSEAITTKSLSSWRIYPRTWGLAGLRLAWVWGVCSWRAMTFTTPPYGGRSDCARGNLIHLGSDAEDEEYVPRGTVSYY
jgi:hypothetical protein